MSKETIESILDCGHPPSEHSDITTGYGVDRHGAKHCYACCAERDKAQMIRDGKIAMYLAHDPLTGNYSSNFGRYLDGTVSNWPGSLKFTARVRVGSHNIAGRRYDAWFNGPDGKPWYGVQYGDNTQIIHCKRLKG